MPDILRQFHCYAKALEAAKKAMKLLEEGNYAEALEKESEMQEWYEEYKQAGGKDKLLGFDAKDR